MATVSFGQSITIKQAADVILACPQNRYLLQGEPGIGKSSIIKTLSEALPGYETAYIDVPNMDLGDIAMPVVDRDTKTTTYYPNSRFKFHTGKPVIVMLDEFTKGAEPVKNMLHPLLEVHNPRLGDMPIHPDSRIFLTGNLSSDGVGDNLKAHSRNRIIPISVRKPNAEEWLAWAAANDIDPVVMAWAKQYPHAFASYMDEGQESNPYIYNPKKVQLGFVTPRSMEAASRHLKGRAKLDEESIMVGLIGAIGEAAARDMSAFIAYQNELPSWDSIVKNPESARVPEGAGACAVMVFGALQRVDRDSISPFMQYLKRMQPEWQACFALHIAKDPKKQALAFKCEDFAKWVAENEDLL